LAFGNSQQLKVQEDSRMTVLNNIAELGSINGPVVLAIGFFDGVHVGHQQVIAQALHRARERSATMVLMTFDPHPLRVLRPEIAPKLLCSTEHQMRVLTSYGVTHVLLCKFDREFAEIAAETFVERLKSACSLDSIFVGESWKFGKGRRGDVAMIRSVGVDAFGVPSVMHEDKVVSSTLVRQAVERGDLPGAKALLGRDYTVLGRVIQDRQLARQLGFPTANLDVQNEQLPPVGVYVVEALLDDVWLPGVANLGRRPTVVDEGALSLEVHLLDFARDIYGHLLEVRFLQHLRNEKKFNGLDELKAQIAIDVSMARAL